MPKTSRYPNMEVVTPSEGGGLRRERGEATSRLPVLSGIKVLDFSWSAAAPIATRMLADAGAFVIRVESHAHPDSIRFGGPFRDNIPGINRSGFFADFNSSKFSLGLDMRIPEAQKVAAALAEWSDVLVESFRPGVMERWGLSYSEVAARNPRTVYLSSCMFGQSGPLAQYPAYGGQGAALTGIHAATGWPDRLPCGPKGAYTDTIAPYLTLCAIVGALIERERSGMGQYIDFAQAEGALQFYGPELIAARLNGDPGLRDGNRSRRSVPHGAFPCRGNDRWITLDVADDAEWATLAATPGAPRWMRDEELATVEGRLARQSEVEEALAEWTIEQDAYDLMIELQERGVVAGVVQKASDLFKDPQLAHRGHFKALDHEEMGTCHYNMPSWRMTDTVLEPRWAAPLLGEHTEMILRTVVGMDDQAIEELRAAGALN